MNDLERVREIARTALTALERSRRRIDDLNVYPVPDGDTGTNLTLTGRAVVDGLEGSSATGRPEIAHDATRAALLGARGNSGVIFSQIRRGAAETLAAEVEIAEDVLVRAFRAASDAAYRAVRQPVEGTMLSVIREMAEEAEARPANRGGVAALLEQIVQRGEEAVARTREQLDVLREAGVVDAGGAGLLEIVRGVKAAVAGEQLPDAPVEREELAVEAIHQELSRYRYCTTFVVEGEGLDAEAIETAPAEGVIVLPNNANVILAAEQAAAHAQKRAEVVPADSLPAGLAAMVVFDGEREVSENAAEMREALAGVSTGEVTVASRDAELNGVSVSKGAYLGLADGEAVAVGADFDEVAAAVVDRLLAEPRGVLTLLTGEDEPDLTLLLQRLGADHPEVEVEVQSGGQPHYPLLLGAE